MFQRSPQQPGEGGATSVSDESVDSAACGTSESESGSNRHSEDGPPPEWRAAQAPKGPEVHVMAFAVACFFF